MDIADVIITKENTPPNGAYHQQINIEEGWHKEIEHQIIKWRKHSIKMKDLHNDAGYYYKTRKVRYGLIPIVIPLAMSPLSVLIMSAWVWGTYFNAMMLALIGIMSGLVQFFSPGELMQLHFSFSARYSDVVSDIDAELVRYRQFRTAADVFTLKIKMMVDNLAFQEPVIPRELITGSESMWGEFGAFCCCISQKKTQKQAIVSSAEIVGGYMQRRADTAYRMNNVDRSQSTENKIENTHHENIRRTKLSESTPLAKHYLIRDVELNYDTINKDNIQDQ